MASTGFINGTMIGLYIEGVLTSYSTNCSMDASMETREVTNKQSGGNAEFRESKKTTTYSGDFIHAPDAAVGVEEMYAYLAARTMVTVRMSTEVSGDKFYEGEAYITSINLTAPMEDNVTYTMSLQVTGKNSLKTQT